MNIRRTWLIAYGHRKRRWRSQVHEPWETCTASTPHCHSGWVFAIRASTYLVILYGQVSPFLALKTHTHKYLGYILIQSSSIWTAPDVFGFSHQLLYNTVLYRPCLLWKYNKCIGKRLRGTSKKPPHTLHLVPLQHQPRIFDYLDGARCSVLTAH